MSDECNTKADHGEQMTHPKGHCYKVSQLITLKKDGRLTWIEQLMLSTHLVMCKKCRQFTKNVDEMSAMMRSFNRQD
ncbi:hypothetical protein LU293_03600 [Moraxella nasovis]|uniref:hypothetical protein n=1 Tax=Moraxella nasovis TaxID=2904121 RepID=UPI001F605E75|nr:hypothetical protein [Moraxella nasovis]UNU73988.1 hypothetical protein LU293_03600 [Moraxella nasovis]